MTQPAGSSQSDGSSAPAPVSQSRSAAAQPLVRPPARRATPAPVYSWTDPYTKGLADQFEQVKASGAPTARTDAQEIARELQRRGYKVQGLGPDEWPSIQAVLPPGARIADPETLNQKYLFEVNKALGNYDAAEQYGRLLQKKGWEYGYPNFGAPYVRPPANHPYAPQLTRYGIPSVGDVQGIRAQAQARWARNASKLGLDPDDPRNMPLKPAAPPDYRAPIFRAIDQGTSDIVSGATDWAARNLRGLGNTINAAVPPQMLESPWQQQLGPEGVASMGQEYEGPSLGQPFRVASERVAKTSAEYSARGLDTGFLKDALHTVGATVPALLLRHPALIGLSGALESMAGDPDVQRAVIEGVKSAAAVALMGGAANLIGETGMGALPRFFARASANVVIPAIMNGRVPTLQDLAFATGFALMHGGPQDEQAMRQRAAKLQEVAADPERHPDIEQSLQDVANGKFDGPPSAQDPPDEQPIPEPQSEAKPPLKPGLGVPPIPPERLDNLWERAQRGEATDERGQPSELLLWADIIRRRGALNNRDVFDRFAQQAHQLEQIYPPGRPYHDAVGDLADRTIADVGRAVTPWEIASFVDEGLSTEPAANRLLNLGPVDDANVRLIKDNIGLDVSGYERVLDTSAARHIIKQHGEAKSEASRGLIAITAHDFGRIPEIVNSPDTITVAREGANKLQRIEYTKRVNGVIYYYEEVRTGRRQLVPVTLFKRRIKQSP